MVFRLLVVARLRVVGLVADLDVVVAAPVHVTQLSGERTLTLAGEATIGVSVVRALLSGVHARSIVLTRTVLARHLYN